MRLLRLAALAALVAVVALAPADSPAIDPAPAPRPTGRAEAAAAEYVKKDSRADTIRATLASHGLPNLEGKWYYAGPFDNTEGAGFDFVYPPEKSVDLKANYAGRAGARSAGRS